MRRAHNVAVSTLLLIGIVYLFAQPNDGSRLNAISTPNYDSSAATRHHDSSLAFEATKPLPDYSAPETAPITLQDVIPEVKPNSPLADNGFSETDPASLGSIDVPSLPEAIPASKQETAPQTLEVEYQFQKDLDLDLPVDLLRSLANNHPHNYDSDGPKTYAFATFMATHNPSLKDPYYLAIHSLIYRLLWAQKSKTAKYPLIVFVAPFVTPEQRSLLAGAGAIIRDLDLVEWKVDGVPNMQKRWRDQFSKLNMWKETEFDRIAFLDADALPLTNIDELFNQASMRSCDETKLVVDDYLPDQNPVCENYVFAGVPSDPFKPESMVNGGVLLFSPSMRMHQRLLQNYPKVDHYDVSLVEQGLLGWQFARDGAFPSTALAREWGAYFPQEEEQGKLKVVHEKIWVATDGWMKKEWEDTWIEMLGFYGSNEFREMRAQDNIGFL